MLQNQDFLYFYVFMSFFKDFSLAVLSNWVQKGVTTVLEHKIAWYLRPQRVKKPFKKSEKHKSIKNPDFGALESIRIAEI